MHILSYKQYEDKKHWVKFLSISCRVYIVTLFFTSAAMLHVLKFCMKYLNIIDFRSWDGLLKQKGGKHTSCFPTRFENGSHVDWSFFNKHEGSLTTLHFYLHYHDRWPTCLRKVVSLVMATSLSIHLDTSHLYSLIHGPQNNKLPLKNPTVSFITSLTTTLWIKGTHPIPEYVNIRGDTLHTFRRRFFILWFTDSFRKDNKEDEGKK